MPKKIQNNWTLRKLIQNTYAHQYSRSRFVYEMRDMVKVIRVEKVSVYDGKNPGTARTKFVITTRSTPQYYPYYTKKDAWGRTRQRQLRYQHQYAVTIQLDKLSIDVPFKGRVGAVGTWDFSKRGSPVKLPNGKIKEGTNYIKGINADFWFRCSWVWQQEGILFGRNYAKGAPIRVNPQQIVFAPKHFLAVVQYLMERGILK